MRRAARAGPPAADGRVDRDAILLALDADQIIMLYVTPHRWTPFYREAMQRRVLLTDKRRCDYRHQVLANPRVPAWRTFLAVKLMEALLQARPRALRRTYFNRDPLSSHGMRWYARVGRRVWLHEIRCFLVRDRRTSGGPTLAELWGPPQHREENALSLTARPGAPVDDAAE